VLAAGLSVAAFARSTRNPQGPPQLAAATAGYRTFAGFEPSRHIGVVVLTNSGGAGADDIG